MFTAYFMEHPSEPRDIVIDRWSYLLAAIAGPFYALWLAGYREALKVAAFSLLAIAAIIVVIGVTSYMSYFNQALGLVGAALAYFAFQAHKTIAIVKRTFMRRGWCVNEI